MSETSLSREIKAALETLGVWVIRVQSGVILAKHGGRIHCAEPGTPDLFCVDLNLWLEVKRPKGQRSRIEDSQQRWHERAKCKGVRVRIVRSVAEALAAVAEARAA